MIGKSTVESIQSGALYGFAGQVDGLCRRFAAVLGECTVVATGGLSELISPYSEEIEYVEPWLTLHGLRIIFERNSPRGVPAVAEPAARASDRLLHRTIGAPVRAQMTGAMVNCGLPGGTWWYQTPPSSGGAECTVASRGAPSHAER